MACLIHPSHLLLFTTLPFPFITISVFHLFNAETPWLPTTTLSFIQILSFSTTHFLRLLHSTWFFFVTFQGFFAFFIFSYTWLCPFVLVLFVSITSTIFLLDIIILKFELKILSSSTVIFLSNTDANVTVHFAVEVRTTMNVYFFFVFVVIFLMFISC